MSVGVKVPARPGAHPRGDLRPTDVLGAFFLAGLFFLLAAAVAGVWQAVEPWGWGRWLALHLAFVGGISQLVLGASQFFAGAFLATDPPPRKLVRIQLGFWSAGAALLMLAAPLRLDALVWVAVVSLLVALVAWARALAVMKKRSLSRAPWATRWYEAAAGFFAVGIIAGAVLAEGIAWRHGSLHGGHMVLNLAGWFGVAIVGTLHTFYPSLTRTMLRFPKLQPVTFRLWCLGVIALVVGYAWAIEPLARVGWLVLLAAAIVLLINIVASRRGAGKHVTLAGRLVGAAQIFLPLGLAVLAWAAFTDGPIWSFAGSTRTAAGTLLVAGWVGMTVLGSLLHLLGVMVGVRSATRLQPVAGSRPDLVLTVLAVAGVIALAVCQLLEAETAIRLARLILLLAYAAVAAKVLLLGVAVVRHARPEV